MVRRLNVLMLLLSTPAIVAAQAPSAGAVAVVTGEGVVQAIPDRAWITIAAESRASSPREAQRRNAEARAPVIDKLRAAGIHVSTTPSGDEPGWLR